MLPKSADAARPRRSVLFMPASNARALDKARTLPADVLIFDLEDAVAPEAKPEARAMACAAAGGGYGRREVVVRVNGLDTPWGADDLDAVASSGADAVLLPKVESPDAVARALDRLGAAGAPETLALWCMIETPLGVLRAEAIAAASPRVGALVVGTSDLAKDLRARPRRDRLPLLLSLQLVVLAARAHGRVVLDGVHLDLGDDEGLVAACRQGRELGFDGKTLIHPRQIGPANEAFMPSAAEVARARRVIAAHEKAIAAGLGVVVLDGQLVENLHAEEACRVVALADAIAELTASNSSS
jgi:citrate lyase subunit beta/citryl-CoA lyase